MFSSNAAEIGWQVTTMQAQISRH